MRTWILYRRKNLSGEKEITFGVDIHKGGGKNMLKLERTIAPGKGPTDLAKLVVDSPISIALNDILTSLERLIFIPGNNYIDMPVTAKEINEFYTQYIIATGA